MADNTAINQIKAFISDKQTNIAKLISEGFTVTIRPVKDGVKITSHKEKTV